ncbi:MAG: hypothetical protein KTR31_07315 [Myxococcales bacterium]|nr:hypothetical protein [Myxococcales bacterium]
MLLIMKTDPRLLVLLGITSTAVHTGCTSFRDCSTVDVSAAEALPTVLSETSLYSDIANDVVAEAAFEFTPRFPLWTDGAKKRRWLLLPQGEPVDTQHSDDWAFPVGTKFFKEFTRDGVRVETRMNLRTEDGWTAIAYIWNDAGDDAWRQLERAEDVSGTSHDVPGAAECLACHAGRRNFTLGFSATQLDSTARMQLYDAGMLSHPAEDEIGLDPTALAGLGVLHGNCSHCHNDDRDQQPQATDCYSPDADDSFDVTLPPDLATVEESPALLTARWLLGGAGDSEVIDRMSHRNLSEGNPSMPPLGTEIVDDEGIAAVRAFIDELPTRDRN